MLVLTCPPTFPAVLELSFVCRPSAHYHWCRMIKVFFCMGEGAREGQDATDINHSSNLKCTLLLFTKTSVTPHRKVFTSSLNWRQFFHNHIV